jgi:hypothetical protein
MTLDQLILSCVFHQIQSSCNFSAPRTLENKCQNPCDSRVEWLCSTGPGGQDDDELETYVDTVTFKLPKVVFDWTASPPPPPPATFGAFHDLSSADPEGMENLREALLEFWPSLT